MADESYAELFPTAPAQATRAADVVRDICYTADSDCYYEAYALLQRAFEMVGGEDSPWPDFRAELYSRKGKLLRREAATLKDMGAVFEQQARETRQKAQEAYTDAMNIAVAGHGALSPQAARYRGKIVNTIVEQCSSSGENVIEAVSTFYAQQECLEMRRPVHPYFVEPALGVELAVWLSRKDLPAAFEICAKELPALERWVPHNNQARQATATATGIMADQSFKSGLYLEAKKLYERTMDLNGPDHERNTYIRTQIEVCEQSLDNTSFTFAREVMRLGQREPWEPV